MEKLQETLDSAIQHSDDGNEIKAIELYMEILNQKDDWSIPHYNLGLIYKYQLKWDLSFKHNYRAVQLDPEHESSQWNLGIAATMLKKWKIARKCWNNFGMAYEDSDMDPAGDLGMAPVRINPESDAEVIWAIRIDPARAKIRNIPFPESNHKYNDLILIDGAPMGKRLHKGKEYSVFNELQILKKSKYQTFSFECDFNTMSNYEILEQKCISNEIEIENWTTDIEFLCRACSEGTPHESHKPEPVFKNKKMTIAFASKSEDLLCNIVNNWSRENHISFDEFYKD